MGWLSKLATRWRAPGRKEAPVPSPPRRTEPEPAQTISQWIAPVAPSRSPPCSPDVIAAAAERVLAHFDQNRPGPASFPNMAARIMDLLAAPDPDFNRLVQALGQDVAVTAKLLQVANSALHARGEEVETVRGAVLKLGMREVGQLAVGIAGRSLFETESRAEYALFPLCWDRLFHDAMTAAFSAGQLSLSAGAGRSDSAFLAGLLHDIGKPIALRSLASLFVEGKLDRGALEGGVDALLERVHVEIGAVLTDEWALPEYLKAAAARHHEAEIPADRAHDELHIVRVVDGLKAHREGAILDEQRLILRNSAAALRLAPRMLRVCATEHVELAARVTEIFGVADPLVAAAAHAA